MLKNKHKKVFCVKLMLLVPRIGVWTLLGFWAVLLPEQLVSLVKVHLLTSQDGPLQV